MEAVMDFDNISNSAWIQDDAPPPPPPSNFSLASNVSPTARTASAPACRNPAYFYAMGVVIPFGFFSNVFCLTVFTLSAGLRRTTTGHYLTALACADTLFLVGDSLRWMNTEGCMPFRFMHTSNAACKLIFWLRYGAKLVSAWVTVSIATERFITVSFPLKVSLLSTVGRAKIIIVALYVFGFSFGSYALWTVESNVPKSPMQQTRCVTPAGLKPHYDAWNTAVNMVGTLVLPGLLITVLTTMTVVILLRASRRRREHMEGQPVLSPGAAGRSALKMTISGGAGGGGGGGGGRQTSCTAAERQLTATLVAVCVAFIVLRLPNTILYFMAETLSMKTWPRAGLTAGRRVADVIATSNYVVNLMLYCLFGSYFRQQVVVVYGCRRRCGRRFGGSDGERGVAASSLRNGSDYYYSKSRASTVTRASIV